MTSAIGNGGKTAVLLINLGSPDAPTTAAVKRYLRQFLSDPNVIPRSGWLWWLILNGWILNLCSPKTAVRYERIWTPEGAPLKVHTEKQAKLIKGWLGMRGHSLLVDWAMRYGKPSIAQSLSRLHSEGATRILAVPLYPQYARCTQESVRDEISRWLSRTPNPPELQITGSFCNDEGYLTALEQTVRTHWQKTALPGPKYCLVLSFHGLPKKSVEAGDPYHQECLLTGRLLAERLNLPPDRYRIAFQSRWGHGDWLQPDTAETLKTLGSGKNLRVDVLCPGFVADCLETLGEIAGDAKTLFVSAGGHTFNHIPALNEHPVWISALANLIEKNLAAASPNPFQQTIT